MSGNSKARSSSSLGDSLLKSSGSLKHCLIQHWMEVHFQLVEVQLVEVQMKGHFQLVEVQLVGVQMKMPQEELVLGTEEFQH